MDNRSASHKKVTIKIDNDTLGVFDVPIASDSIDYYGFIDLSNYQGKKVNVEVLKYSGDINKISLNDNILDDASYLYNEKYRPQLHFTTKRGWINDPNGLIYYKGKYHMYYQYNPFGTKWGNISWGHAVSNDLVHWEEQPAVLYPNPETGMCWSGAAFIDKDNQLGLKTGNEDVIMAFYLRTETGLSYAYSNNGGHKFTDFEDNPVLSHNGARIDTPRPFWFEPTKKWIAPTYDFFTNDKGEKQRCVGFYSSVNLTDWQFESRVEQNGWGDELCGCVDFFQLPVDGNTADEKWVMIFIDGSYIVGNFDGKTFYTLDGKPASTEDRKESLVIDGNYYATMTWHNMPNNRRVQVTWMRYWNKTFEKGAKTYLDMPFNQQFTLPSELTLHKENNDHYLRMNPIKELQKLRTKTHSWENFTIDNTNNILSDLNKDTYEIELEFTPNENSITTLNLHGVEVMYDAQKNEISLNELKTKLKPEKGSVKLQIFIDRTSIEVYANGGKTYLPLIHMMPQDNFKYSILTDRGNFNVQELSSIW